MKTKRIRAVGQGYNDNRLIPFRPGLASCFLCLLIALVSLLLPKSLIGTVFVETVGVTVDEQNPSIDVTLGTGTNHFRIFYTFEPEDPAGDTYHNLDIIQHPDQGTGDSLWAEDSSDAPEPMSLDYGVNVQGTTPPSLPPPPPSGTWEHFSLAEFGIYGNLTWFRVNDSEVKGNFYDLDIGYIAVRFLLNGNWHYGWIEVPTIGAESLTIHRWAYNTTPNEGISMGTDLSRSYSFVSWADEIFTPTEISQGMAAPLFDYGSDGIVNLLNYSAGRDPVTGQGGILPIVTRDSSGTRLQIEFIRDRRNLDILYQVEASSNLVDWDVIAESSFGASTVSVDSLAHSVDESSYQADTYLREVRVVDGETLQVGSPRFLRLNVVVPD